MTRDYLKAFPHADLEAISALLAEKDHFLSQDKKGIERYRVPMESLAHLKAQWVDVSGDAVKIGRTDDIDQKDTELVFTALKDFMPWRKGPFEIFGIPVDAEWRSDRKWQHIAPALPDLKDKVVADIGCSNGYYMFRMTADAPRFVLGFEPFLQHYFAFQTLNRLGGFANLAIETLGVEHIHLFKQSFDVIFLMGILYHHASPITILRNVKEALKPGGTLIVESQIIPGDEPMALFPEGRYAKVPGTYFVPTAPCLRNWLGRAGYDTIELISSYPLSTDEQRRTEWMTFESLADFLDPNDQRLTIEGYPAPHRASFKAVKK